MPVPAGAIRIGRGILAWPKGETQSDRFGLVGLYHGRVPIQLEAHSIAGPGRIWAEVVGPGITQRPWTGYDVVPLCDETTIVFTNGNHFVGVDRMSAYPWMYRDILWGLLDREVVLYVTVKS